MKLNPGMVCLQVGLCVMVCGCLPAAPSAPGNPSRSSSQDTPSRQLNQGPTPSAATNEIIFISMTIFQDHAGSRRTIHLDNLIKKPGILKSRLPKAIPAGPYLQCTLHAGAQVQDTLLLDHPLFKNPEIINAQNNLVRQPVTLQQADFFIRFQQKGADLLVITERQPGSPEQELIRIKL